MRLSVPDMPRRDAWLWLIVLGLVALSGSAMAVSVGVLLLVLVALVTPMFAITIYAALRNPVEATRSRDHQRVAPTAPGRRSPEGSGHEVYRWENEGGGRGEVISRELGIDGRQPHGNP